MDFTDSLTKVAEMLQAPVATSVSGKGCISECHPLAVGWGYGPQATRTAEAAFQRVDLVLAIGVRYGEVSTGFYSIPPHRVIQVDANADNLGKVVKPEVCVHADAGVFLTKLLEQAPALCRPRNEALVADIRQWKCAELKENRKCYNRCGVDPMALILALCKVLCADALIFVDVSASEHWAAEAMTTTQARTYFNPTDNQAMGWSIPAARAQRVHADRQVVTLTGDGCFLMTAMEISTAVREGLAVKFFVLDDQAFHYMQALQQQAYKRTTATVLARLDYEALAKGFGVGYAEVSDPHTLEPDLRGVLEHAGPMLVRVVTDYGQRPLRWLQATKGRFSKELSTEQKVRFLARLGARSLDVHLRND